MGKLVSDHFLEKALPIAEEGPGTPDSLDARVLKAIDEKCLPSRFRVGAGRRVLRRFADAPPALLAAAAALLILCVPALVIRLPAGARPLLTLRSAENASGFEELAGGGGKIPKSGRILRTGEKGHLTLSEGERILLHLFENSEMRLTEAGGGFDIGLSKGAMYLSRTRPSASRAEPRIFLFGHSINLVGTTLYLEYLDASSYRLVCGEGRLEVLVAAGSAAPLAGVEGGGYIDISSDGRILSRGGIEALPEGYRRMFEALKAYSLNGTSVPLDASLPYRVDKDGAGRSADRATAPSPTELEKAAEKPKYRISRINGIEAFKPEEPLRTFARGFSLDGEDYLLLSSGLYAIEERGFEKKLAFARVPVAAPFRIQAGYALFFQDGLAEYSQDFALLREIAYPKKGSLQNNYAPLASGDVFLLPLQGAGLYRFSPAERSFELIDANVFPAGPLRIGDGYLSSTYYRNVYARYGSGGSKEWEFRLSGRSYLDPVAIGRDIYLYEEEDAGQAFIVLGEDGKTKGRIALPEPLLADAAASPEGIFALSTKGTLFHVDIRTGTVGAVKRLYEETMTSGQWRNLELGAGSGRAATITARGEFELLSFDGAKSLVKAKLPAEAPFDLQPLAFGKRYYAIDRSGAAYRVDWLE